jgi:hypothetical protein
MNENLLLVAFLGFSAGYILKTLAYRLKVIDGTSFFVRRITEQLLMLIGAVVYKVSLMEQTYLMLLKDSPASEEAKRVKNEFASEFEDWKKETIEEFCESYPEEFKWQIGFEDWKGAMNVLTDIYKDKKK